MSLYNPPKIKSGKIRIYLKVYDMLTVSLTVTDAYLLETNLYG
jgi:hypothetical protein